MRTSCWGCGWMRPRTLGQPQGGRGRGHLLPVFATRRCRTGARWMEALQHLLAPPWRGAQESSQGRKADGGGRGRTDPLAARLNRPRQGSFPFSICLLLSIEGLLRVAAMTLIKFPEVL